MALQPGMEITVPQYTPMYNGVNTNVPYHVLMGILVPALQPFLWTPQVPPPPQHHESVLKEVIVGVAAVVVAIAAFPLAAGAIAALAPGLLAASAATAAVTVTTAVGTVSLTMAGAMVAGFAAGVASSLVSQGVGLAIHEQNGFSFDCGQHGQWPDKYENASAAGCRRNCCTGRNRKHVGE